MSRRISSVLVFLFIILFGVIACNVNPADSTTSTTSTTTTTTLANDAPTADAGMNQWVCAGVTVTFAGIGSDPEGDDLTYAWTQDASNPAAVTINDADTTNASFTSADGLGVYNYILTVTDSFGNSTSDSMTVSVFEKKFLSDDGAADDWFGYSVSISSDGETMIFGAYQDDDNSDNSGSAYIYKWNGSAWAETKLTAGDAAETDWFGKSVSLSSDGLTAIIGSIGDDDNGSMSGSAYIYKWNGTSWAETKLTASDGAAADYFGNSVAISGDGETAIVGAYNDSNGSVYVYQWNGTDWVETKLTASDGAASDFFGYNVSISADGETAIVGAELNDDNGTDSGSAYIYKWNGSDWVETKLTASDAAEGDYFGNSISLSADGTTALIGAYVDDDNGTDSGSAYIYQWNGTDWAETKLTASDGTASDFFGSFVSLSSDGLTAIVSADNDDDNGTDSGSAYIYQWNGTDWAETKLTASDGAASDKYGWSVSLSGDGETALIGVPYDDDNGYGSGSAYLYDVSVATSMP